MSDADHGHTSPIKTPQQLVAVLVLAFVVPIAGIILLVSFILGNKTADPNSPEMAPAVVAARIKPVGEVTFVDANAPKVLKSGQEVVSAVCGACHGTGAAGAPKIGDKAAWGPRIKEGLAGLLKTAIAGKGAMPARGGSPDLSDLELARAIVFMANQSGASFKEPPAPAGAAAAAPAAGAPAPAAAASAATATAPAAGATAPAPAAGAPAATPAPAQPAAPAADSKKK
jgi:cytochrome c5